MVLRSRLPRSRGEAGGGAGSTAKARGGFLLWLSGADLATLEKCPSERGKFTGVGGVVLTTAVMAVVSCAFALYTGAHAPLPVAIGAALFWGLAIMNLDRWLVTAQHTVASAGTRTFSSRCRGSSWPSSSAWSSRRRWCCGFSTARSRPN